MDRSPIRLAVISSFFSPRFLGTHQTAQVETPWGPAEVEIATVDGEQVACIWRYGRNLDIGSHRINYRANLWALRELGVERVVSQNAIGSCNPDLPPGAVVVSHDLLDFTKDRPRSFFDETDAWVRVDLTTPFCDEVRSALTESAAPMFERFASRGVFLCVEGPRFETRAEIAMFRQLGVDIIGTPLIPEVVLAREAEMCFASIAPIINFAPGLTDEVKHVGPGSMIDFYYRSGFHDRIETAITEALRLIPKQRRCACGNAMAQAFHGNAPSWYRPRR